MKADEANYKFVESNLGVCFPLAFKKIYEDSKEAEYKNLVFSYFDKEIGSMMKEGIGKFLSFMPSDTSNILRKTLIHPQFYKRKIIPFADIGGGNFLCFDYSIEGFNDPNPPIIFWLQGYEDSKNIADVAINFETFLKNLKDEDET